MPGCRDARACQFRTTFINSTAPKSRHYRSLKLRPDKVNGPFAFLNPTVAHFRQVSSSAGTGTPSETSHEEKQKQSAADYEFKWSARNNRKGRHALAIDETAAPSTATPPPTSTPKEIARGLGRMFMQYPVWDVSYLVAVIFTLGSVIWVINAFFVFLPFIRPSAAFPNETLVGGGVTAFIGATVFEIGSVLLILEAVNENRSECFGWAVEKIYEERVDDKAGFLRLRPDREGCRHHHRNKKNLVGKNSHGESPGNGETRRRWVWFPTWYDLKTHYFHELGFLASLSQLIGATIFWISGFTALPGILNKMSPGLTDGIYWTPQVIGGLGFVISGTLFMIETQPKWYIPAFGALGWHIALWNLIGGIGFTICPCFGYDPSHWAQYQALCSTFWGSWAFLIGSVIQWYESLDKHPVEVEKLDSS